MRKCSPLSEPMVALRSEVNINEVPEVPPTRVGLAGSPGHLVGCAP